MSEQTTPTLAQLIAHPLQAECFLHYLREERGDSSGAEAIVELHMNRQITHDDLRRDGLRAIWKRFVVSRKIPLSIPLEEEISSKEALVDANPVSHQDLFHKFEQEITLRLQSTFPTFLESAVWSSYQKATDPETYRRLRLVSCSLPSPLHISSFLFCCSPRLTHLLLENSKQS
jgi:hypothetical protein